jgi:hypothetical protein
MSTSLTIFDENYPPIDYPTRNCSTCKYTDNGEKIVFINDKMYWSNCNGRKHSKHLQNNWEAKINE